LACFKKKAPKFKENLVKNVSATKTLPTFIVQSQETILLFYKHTYLFTWVSLSFTKVFKSMQQHTLSLEVLDISYERQHSL